MATVFILKEWGPVEAFVQYSGDDTLLQAGSLLGAFVIVILVLAYIVGLLAKALHLGELAKGILSLISLIGR